MEYIIFFIVVLVVIFFGTQVNRIKKEQERIAKIRQHEAEWGKDVCERSSPVESPWA